MRYQDFNLQLSSAGEGWFRAQARTSHMGEDDGLFSVSCARAAWAGTVSEGSSLLRDVAKPVEKDTRSVTPEELGDELYQLLFPGRVRSLFERSLERALVEEMGLRLKIIINPRDTPVRFLQDLPWELLRGEATGNFFSLNAETPVVRSLAVPQSPRSPELPGRVRVLAVQSMPRGIAALDLQQELTGMAASGERVDVVSCPARLAEVRRMLTERGPFDVLHFLGHGEFLGNGEGALVFESSRGEKECVRGAILSQTLREFSSVRLVVLNACKTGRATAEGRPFGGVASALVEAGFPSTLAMREAISDDAAIEFSRVLYHEIAQRQPIEAALAMARKAIHDPAPNSLEWVVPILHLRASPWKEDVTARTVREAVELFRSGSYSLARQKCQQALAADPEAYRARLFEILSRMVLHAPLALDGIGKIDLSLQELLTAADPEVSELARLALGLLRFDVSRPRGIRSGGIEPDRLFADLRRSRRTPLEIEIARALRASRDARILFNLNP